MQINHHLKSKVRLFSKAKDEDLSNRSRSDTVSEEETVCTKLPLGTLAKFSVKFCRCMTLGLTFFFIAKAKFASVPITIIR